MFLGISPVAGSINLMRSQTTLSAGLSDAKAIVLFFCSEQEEIKNAPNRNGKILFIVFRILFV